MSKSKINFFSEGINFNLKNKTLLKKWICAVVEKHKKNLASVNFIFCSDDYLLWINKNYLRHNYYTDIITFDNSEVKGMIEADIFISIERIEENSQNLSTFFNNELHRVMIHGILHLLGYKDKNTNDKRLMRKKEDACLSLLSKMNVPRGTFKK